jgi:hypothetical protein
MKPANTPKPPITAAEESSLAATPAPKDSEPIAPSSKSTNYSFQTVVTPGLAFQILGAQKPEE